jgi:plastocyanin
MLKKALMTEDGRRNRLPNRGQAANLPCKVAFLVLACGTLHAASITGSVMLRDSRFDAVNRHKDFSGVVISAEPVNGPPPRVPAKHAVMLQKNKMFTPHILPIETGTTVDFPNADPIFHNAFSSYNGQIFDVGLYPPGTSRSVRFSRPGVVRVFCNIHPTMSAIILVLNTEYFAATGKNGTFELNVPPGEYEVKVFHERSTEQTLAPLSRRIVVTEAGLRLARIEVSEAGFLLSPHKNKYGKDYAPPPDDQIVYPGVRN